MDSSFALGHCSVGGEKRTFVGGGGAVGGAGGDGWMKPEHEIEGNGNRANRAEMEAANRRTCSSASHSLFKR